MTQNYSKPDEEEVQKPSSKILNYFVNRDISAETVKEWDIKEKKGTIVFPYYEAGKLVMHKYRTLDKKVWKNKGGKHVFWGIDKVDVEEPLVICEGPIDCLSIYESGYQNVVSVPMGANQLECLDYAWDKLEKLKEFIIWADNDKPGQELEDELVRRLGAGRCSVVESDYKDANEQLVEENKESVKNAILNAKPIEIDGLINLAKVESIDLAEMTKVKSGIPKINGFTGGYMMGSVSVWTGRNGSGKSTFLGQELIEAIDQGYNVMAYGGELNSQLFQYWIELQLAGPRHILTRREGNETMYRVKGDVISPMRDWYSNHFFLFDNSKSATTSNILNTFQYATRRHGVRLFLIDNLMTVGFESSYSNYYRRQSEFIRKMVSFAKRFDVHVMIVAHPRKTKGKWVRKEDISGTYNISDQVDLVFSLKKIKEQDIKDNNKLAEYDSAILLDKNRLLGKDNEVMGLGFNVKSKRFYYHKHKDACRKKYGWEDDYNEG